MRKNIKRNQSIIIITAILFISTIAVESINSQQNGTILSIENITIEINKIKSAKVLVHNVENFGSFKISISYDTTMLNVVNVDSCEIDEIGISDDVEYEEMNSKLQPGDFICYFTDGITEARNIEESEYGEERIRGVLLKNSFQNAQGITESLMQDVVTFIGDAPQHDDMTILTVKYG